jgi:excisionase family DNA binding protein
VLRVGGDGDQGHGPLGDGRTLANWWLSGAVCFEPPPPHHDAAVPPAQPVTTPPESAEYLTIAAAARHLGCSKGLIRKLLAAPDPMPSVTLGRARRIPRVALDAWVVRRMAAPVGVDDVLAKLRGRR